MCASFRLFVRPRQPSELPASEEWVPDTHIELALGTVWYITLQPASIPSIPFYVTSLWLSGELKITVGIGVACPIQTHIYADHIQTITVEFSNDNRTHESWYSMYNKSRRLLHGSLLSAVMNPEAIWLPWMLGRVLYPLGPQLPCSESCTSWKAPQSPCCKTIPQMWWTHEIVCTKKHPVSLDGEVCMHAADTIWWLQIQANIHTTCCNALNSVHSHGMWITSTGMMPCTQLLPTWAASLKQAHHHPHHKMCDLIRGTYKILYLVIVCSLKHEASHWKQT